MWRQHMNKWSGARELLANACFAMIRAPLLRWRLAAVVLVSGALWISLSVPAQFRESSDGPEREPGEPVTKPRFDLVIAVMSAPDQIDRRNEVRAQWVNEARDWKNDNFSIHVFFYMGKSGKKLSYDNLQAESVIHGDISFYGDVDSYDLLTHKTASLMKFVDDQFEFTHFMKVDNDVPLELEHLIQEVRTLPHMKVYWGKLCQGNVNIERGTHHDTVLRNRMKQKTVPPFMAGPGYILSSDLVECVAYVEKNFKLTKFKNEDVSVGHWMSMIDDVLYVRAKYFPKFRNRHSEKGI